MTFFCEELVGRASALTGVLAGGSVVAWDKVDGVFFVYWPRRVARFLVCEVYWVLMSIGGAVQG